MFSTCFVLLVEKIGVFDWKWPPLSGCGTQHPHRALGGTCVLLAAAPTTPPCFRHWRRSSSLHFGHYQRKNYFKFRVSGKSADFPETHFHGRGRRGNRHLQRRFLRKCGAAGGRLLPLGGAVAQRLRGFKSAEPEKTVKRSSRRTGVNLQFFPV